MNWVAGFGAQGSHFPSGFTRPIPSHGSDDCSAGNSHEAVESHLPSWGCERKFFASTLPDRRDDEEWKLPLTGFPSLPRSIATVRLDRNLFSSRYMPTEKTIDGAVEVVRTIARHPHCTGPSRPNIVRTRLLGLCSLVTYEWYPFPCRSAQHQKGFLVRSSSSTASALPTVSRDNGPFHHQLTLPCGC